MRRVEDEWASLRLSGPPALVAEVAARLAEVLDVEQASPRPATLDTGGRWFAMVRPAARPAPGRRASSTGSGEATAAAGTARRRRPSPQVAGPRVVEARWLGRPVLVVRAQTVEGVWLAASAYARVRRLALAGSRASVLVEWLRPVPYCSPSCGCGRDGAPHFQPCGAGMEGAFRGAFVQIKQGAARNFVA